MCSICNLPLIGRRTRYCSDRCAQTALVNSEAFRRGQIRRSERRLAKQPLCCWCGGRVRNPQSVDPMHKPCRAASKCPPRSDVPDDHPSRWVGDASPVQYGTCGWCERTFVAHHRTHAYCSTDCKVRAKRCRRRGREAGDGGFWTWGDFMRLAHRFDFCCAYCGTKPDRLDPDHVVPLSRGGPNVLTNLLPSCLPCNSDKRDLLLPEWDADRLRRGLSPRTTSWGTEDKRYRHLTWLHAA